MPKEINVTVSNGTTKRVASVGIQGPAGVGYTGSAGYTGSSGDLGSISYNPTIDGTATLDLSIYREHRIQMPAGNISIDLSNTTNATRFIVSITQDGVGGRLITSWFNNIRWPNNIIPILSTGAGKRDTFGFIKTGADTYDGFIVGKNN